MELELGSNGGKDAQDEPTWALLLGAMPSTSTKHWTTFYRCKQCSLCCILQEMMELKLGNNGGKDAQDEPTKGSLAGGCCFDFNKAQDHLFVVGTEEGHIHKCSQAYNSEYLQTYTGADTLVLIRLCLQVT